MYGDNMNYEKDFEFAKTEEYDDNIDYQKAFEFAKEEKGIHKFYHRTRKEAAEKIMKKGFIFGGVQIIGFSKIQ